MAFDLPPPATPQLTTAEPAQAGERITQVTYQQYTLYVSGAKIVDEAMLKTVIASAPTLSDAVRNIASTAYAAGYPAANVLYSLVGTDLYIHITPGKVAAVNAPEPLRPFLEGIESADPLTDSALEPRRTLAAMYAERAGLDAQASWIPDASNQLVLNVSDAEGKDPLTISAELGNPGNRFVGRHFADLTLRDGTSWGDEIRATFRSGVKGLNDSPGSDHYYEGSLGWSRVTPYGLFGLGYRAVDFDLFTFTPTAGGIAETEFDGQILTGEAFWFYPIYASFNTRVTQYLKVDRIRKITEVTITSQELQRELYSSAEAGVVFARTFNFFGKRHDLESGWVVRKGLSDKLLRISAAEGDYFLARPSAKLKHHVNQSLTASLELSGQYSKDSVPEQSQWVIGGLNGLTAFLPGVAVGDRGYLTRLQCEYLTTTQGLEITTRGFVEYANARTNAGNASLHAQAADVGVGVDVKINPSLSLGLAYAYAFHDRDIPQSTLDDAKANVYFKISARF